MPEEKLPLILHPGSGIARVGPQSGRIVSEMVSDALALSRAASAMTQLPIPLWPFKIGDHELCETDYRQILRWAEALGIEPIDVIESLSIEPDFETQYAASGCEHELDILDIGLSKIKYRRITCLAWNFKALPLFDFEMAEDMAIEELEFSGRSPSVDGKLIIDQNEVKPWSFSLSLPKLRDLECSDTQLSHVDLSRVPELTGLRCSLNQISALDLSCVPQLTRLNCDFNRLSRLDASRLMALRQLNCSFNQLTELHLPHVTTPPLVQRLTRRLAGNIPVPAGELEELNCTENSLTKIDLSGVPKLQKLWCCKNALTQLDIRPLFHLKTLSYDVDRTRLIQRPDQHF
jgi:Leucine-rich repeat (LRR) protein